MNSYMRYILLLAFALTFCLGCTSDNDGQTPERFELSASEFSIPQAGSEETVGITAFVAWAIECKASWIHFMQTTGEGNALVTFTVDENTETEERSVTVKVASGNKFGSFRVTQDGTNGAIAISPANKQVNPSGETFTVAVDAKGMEWEYEMLSEDTDWLEIAEKQTSALKLTAKLNNSKSKRSTGIRIKLKNDSSSKTLTLSQDVFQQSIAGKKWLSLALTQPDSWYGSNEAVEVAENVLLYQRNLGGWPKNIEMHLLLTDSEKKEVETAKSMSDAIFDNDATTTEMRFLAKMYKHVPDDRYRMAFAKGVDYIISAQYANGGWPQFFPLKGTYSDNITFNDDLMVNLLRLLKEVADDKGDMEAIVEKEVADKALVSYNKGVQCILDCQVVEESGGQKTFWCAQHNPQTLHPAYGRPHEFPSYSGAEGARVLEFLMEIEQPSEEVKAAVRAAVQWLNEHKIPNKKVVDIKNGSEILDRVVRDAPGEDMWGRFIQLGGTLATEVYAEMEKRLENSKKDMTINGVKITFNYKDNVVDSYKPENAYQPIYGIYEATLPYLLYRFLYIYEDAPNTSVVKNGVRVQVPTSLNAERRVRYQYLGNWPYKALRTLWPEWSARYGE